MHAETLIRPDPKDQPSEPRFLAIGRTQDERYAFVVFTRRRRAAGTRLRPISALYVHQRELKKYEQEIARAEKR